MLCVMYGAMLYDCCAGSVCWVSACVMLFGLMRVCFVCELMCVVVWCLVVRAFVCVCLCVLECVCFMFD